MKTVRSSGSRAAEETALTQSRSEGKAAMDTFRRKMAEFLAAETRLLEAHSRRLRHQERAGRPSARFLDASNAWDAGCEGSAFRSATVLGLAEGFGASSGWCAATL